ncbi:hypothetical protein AWENTII_005549 [Aspergillus wentii]
MTSSPAKETPVRESIHPFHPIRTKRQRKITFLILNFQQIQHSVVIPYSAQCDSIRSDSIHLIRSGSHRIHGNGVFTAEFLALLADAGDVGAAGGVPQGDVLLHAAGQAGAFVGGDGLAGVGNAVFEAVLVDFLLLRSN